MMKLPVVATARLLLLLLSMVTALAFVPPSVMQRTTPAPLDHGGSTSNCNMQSQQEPRGVDLALPQETSSKMAAASLLSATLLLAPLALPTPAVAAAKTAATTAADVPASISVPKKAVAASSTKAASAVPAEKLQVEIAAKALQDAGAKVLAANRDLVVAKSASERADLNVEQLKSKTKAAKEELAKLQAAKPSTGADKKLGAWYQLEFCCRPFGLSVSATTH